MQSVTRGRLLAGAALGLGLTMVAVQPAYADSVCAPGSATLPSPSIGVDCTDPNGNGHSEAQGVSIIGVTFVSPTAVLDWFGEGTNAFTTGYIESTTAGRGVLNFVTDQPFTYVGTGSTLVSQATATGAVTLGFTAPSVTLNTGTLTALGAGSTALSVTAIGGAGSGGIGVTVDGDVLSAGPGIVLNQSNVAATGNVSLTSTAGNTITSNAGTAIDINTAGTGTITVITGDDVIADAGTAIDISATNAAAGAISVTHNDVIRASAGDGIVINTAGTGNVTVNSNDGILSAGGGAGTLQNGIVVTSTGTGNIAVNHTAGAIGAAADLAQGTGILATINNAASAGAINVSLSAGSGINTVGDGIRASTNGTGNITVNSGGAVTSTSGSGIFTAATTGLTTINVTGGAVTGGGIWDGITAVATTGNIGVNVTGGNATSTGAFGVFTSNSGNSTITVGAGRTVTGPIASVFISGAGGTGLVSNSGTIGTAGGLAVSSLDKATTINNLTGATLNGSVMLSGLADTLANTGTWNAAGVSDFGAGADVVTNNTGGVINIAAATSLLGLETLTNAGTVNATSGVTFDAGATAITNTGTFNAGGTLDFAGGTDSFANNVGGTLNFATGSTLTGLESLTNAGTTNVAGTLAAGGATLTSSGTLNLAAASAVSGLGATTLGGTINAGAGSSLAGTGAFSNTGTLDTAGAFTLSGFTTLSNSGTLDLAPGIFTVPAVVFTNSGTILADEGASTITGQTSFANSGTIDLQDGAVGDVLTINSAFAGSGGSNLLIDFNDTVADQLVIAGAASGSTTINANFLGSGLINVGGVLVVDTTTTAANAFVLGTVGGDTPLVDFSLVQQGQDFFLISAPNEAAFNPLLVPGFATDLWYQSADEVFAETRKPATTVGASFWGEGYISRDRYGNDDDHVTLDGVEFEVNNRLKTKRRGIQLGVDYGFGDGRIGLTGGYAWAKANGPGDADLKARGWNLGVYGQFGGLTGFHGEFLAKHDRYKGEFDDGAFDGEEFDIRSNGIDGSLGYRFGMGGAATMDVHAGLSHVRTKVDDISAFGFDYDIGKLTSTRGRAGLRAIFGAGIAPYVDATVYREFSNDRTVELFDGGSRFDLDTNGKATWVRIEAGLSGNNGPGPILAAWGDLGDRKGLGLRAGWRFGGARIVEAAPLPPVYVAPPPPPAPATQTCPDGSVILATDTCPPVPEPYVPPPPPPPAPERG